MSDQTDPLFLAIEGTRPSLPTDAERGPVSYTHLLSGTCEGRRTHA